MNKITRVVMKTMENSRYLKPQRMEFVQDGVKKNWDMIGVPDSVTILIYNPKKETLIFVKQFRPAVYFECVAPEDRQGAIDVNKYSPEMGITLELCTGLVDKAISLENIAKEEVLEECGYDVPVEKLQLISTYRSGIGTTGSLQTAFYCEVDDSLRVSAGGGVNSELIEVVEMTIPQVREYISKQPVNSPPSFLYGVYWFLEKYRRNTKSSHL